MKILRSCMLIPVLLSAACLVSTAQPADTATSVANPVTKTPVNGDWQKGRQLFIGNTRFANDGPACSSCHNVNIMGFTTGGALAKDLTQAVTRLTVDGVKGFIAGMGVPQMQQSYAGKNLTEQEVNDLLAFLSHADELAKSSQPVSKIGKRMLTGGIAGVLALLLLFSFFWIKRKQQTVNYDIYERQIRSH